MQSRRDFFYQKSSSIHKNQRLTGIAGAILFVLIIVELVITANLDNLLSFHIFVGILLSGPLVVKMLSTGYRFARYYTRSPEYVRGGPPKPLLRILAPFLVLTTILVFVSGFLLIKYYSNSLIIKLHAVSVAIWLPLLAIHLYAYLKKVPGLVARDLTNRPQYKLKGRKARIRFSVASLIIGAIAAFILTPWHIGKHASFGVPTPLILGLAAAVFAVLFIIVQKIKNRKAKWIVGTAGVAAFSAFVISHHSSTPTAPTAQAKTTIKANAKPHKATETSGVNTAGSKDRTKTSTVTSPVSSSTASNKTTTSPSSSSTASTKTTSSSSNNTTSSKTTSPSSGSTATSKTTSPSSSSTQSGRTNSTINYSKSTQSSGSSSDRQSKASKQN